MLKYLKKYWFLALLAPLAMVGEVIMDLLQPTLMRIIVDEGVLGLSNNGISDLNLIIGTGLKMIGTVAIGGVFGVLSGVFANLCSQNFGNDIRKDCFKKVMSYSFTQTDTFTTGSLITRITNDVTQVQNFVAHAIRGFVRTAMIFGGGIFCMLSLDLSFGAVLACTLPIVLASVIFFIAKANPNFAILQKKLDKVNVVMQENVSGARVVKAYVRENYEKNRFKNANDELVQTQLKVLKLFAYMTPITNIVLNLSVVAVIRVGGIQVEAGVLTPGSVMAAITYTSQILHGVMMMSMIFQTASRGFASAKRLREVLDVEPVIKSGKGVKETDIKGKLEFKNISFSYGGGEQVLRDINLKIDTGETIGILGATGSGKSSLVNLIPRFYEANSGEILFNSINIKEYTLEDLRSRIAFVMQKSELFSTTIKENILWGKMGANDSEVEEAAKIAQAHEFISSKEEGYNEPVLEKGMSLSGGQKQRIAISRAILKNSEILIFDDSTSALDLKTEQKLYQALNNKYSDKTKIIIAQRITSVKNADRIIVIENGTIAAEGSHDELITSSELYRDIYNSQLSGENGGQVS